MKLSKVDGPYGAPMGRRVNTSERTAPMRLHLARCPLNAGGYDRGGAYWGRPSNLYRAWGDGPTEEQEYFVRAESRDAAKRAVSLIFQRATFYR